jgi:heat shock protein 5
MIRDAEQFADEDKKAKEKIDAKNSLDSYIHSMKNTVEDKEKLADKMEESDKETVLEAVKEAREWLDSHADAEKEDLEE